MIFYTGLVTLIVCYAFEPKKFGIWLTLETLSTLGTIVLLLYAVVKLSKETK